MKHAMGSTGNPPVKQYGGRMRTTEDEAFLAGLLVGEGSFGGDGRQPQVTLRMHTRHGSLFTWIVERFPGGKLYGPYHHGGRSYYQWMARGPFLREELVPILDRFLDPARDTWSAERYAGMKATYGLGNSGLEPGTPFGRG